MRRKRAAAMASVAIACWTVGLISGNTLPAHADVVITDASSYAVDVPSSVLAAAAGSSTLGGALVPGQLGALMANDTKFNSDWVTTSVGQEMGGSSTTAPPDPSTLTPSEETFWEQLEAGMRGAPATSLGTFAKVGVGIFGEGALGAAGVSVVGAVGRNALEFFGVPADEGLCATPDDAGVDGFDGGTATDAFLRSATALDCDKWQESHVLALAPNADAVSGGLSCVPSEPTVCIELKGRGPSFPFGNRSENMYCFKTIGTQSEQWHAYWSDGTDSEEPAMATGDANPNCAAFPTGSQSFMPTDLLQNPPTLTAYGCTQNLAECADGGTKVSVVQNNPVRKIECTVTMTDGSTAVQDSPTFTEEDAILPVPVSPAIPKGEVAASEVCVELGGPAPLPVIRTDTTQPYQQWADRFPQCQDNSCLTDLRKNGASCLFTLANCDGWLTDPDRDSTYTCFIGTQQVALSECDIYGPTFNADNRASGHAYGDPSTGQSVSPQTSPTVRQNAVWTCVAEYDSKVTGSQQTWGSFTGKSRSDWNDDCSTEPIFLTGNDTPKSSQHDLDVISKNPSTMFLQYVSNAEKPRVSWYRTDPTCVTAHANDLDCDEYPYQSTEQGYGGFSEIDPISLEGVPGVGDNQLQGNRLTLFYRNPACPFQGSIRGDPDRSYVVVALPVPLVPTVGLCVP